MQATNLCFQPRTAWTAEEAKMFPATAITLAVLSHCNSLADRTGQPSKDGTLPSQKLVLLTSCRFLGKNARL